MKVSVVIPARPGVFPEKVIISLRNISSPSPVIEILLAEGYYPSLQRNEAAKQAAGDILYLLDDDSIVPSHLFNSILSHFNYENVIAVGGPSLTPQSDTFLQGCFGHALASPFGSHRSSFRYASRGRVRRATEIDLIGCNLALRRNVFLKEGGLNLSLHPNEETELLDRLLRKGYIILYDPDAYIYRSQRKSLYEFSKQIFTYGKGRMEQTFLRPSWIRPFYFVTLIFCLYLAFLPFLRDISWAFVPIALYFILAFGESARIACKNRDWRFLLVMPWIFLIMHISHGFGLFWGLISRPFTRKPLPSVSDIRVTRYEGCDNLPTS